MKNYIYKVFLCCILLIGFVPLANADNITFKAESERDAVIAGEAFRISFSISSLNIKNFVAPAMNGFTVLSGPYSSTSSSTQIINGKMSSSSSTTYTFVLQANKEGNFTIPGASAIVDGKKVTSNSISIKVLSEDKNTGKKSSGSRIHGNDIFIVASVDKSTCYEQEPVLLTYKLYFSNVDFRDFDDIKLPDFKGFNAQQIELPQNKRLSMDKYKGRNYYSVVCFQYLLYPQQPGTLKISPAKFIANIAVQLNNGLDDFDAFFGSQMSYVKKALQCNPVVIKTLPLPSSGKPANFSGAVGDFQISSSVNATSLKTNDALTYKLSIKGSGNLKVINAPTVDFPDSFEKYDPKEEVDGKVQGSNFVGTKKIEYLAIPREAGKYTIPSVSFCYFDIKSKSYKTIHTDEYSLNVIKGKGDASKVVSNFINKEDLKVINQDIRFINTKNISLRNRGESYFNSLSYWMWYICPLIILIVIIALRFKIIKDNSDVVRMKTRKANKAARKRMKYAEKLMRQDKKEDFYDEVLKALWGYVSDKLAIPQADLTKDNIEEELTAHNVSSDLAHNFIDLLNKVEFVRYAPSASGSSLEDIYNEAVQLIGKMDDIIK